jgi:hypothetical protein
MAVMAVFPAGKFSIMRPVPFFRAGIFQVCQENLKGFFYSLGHFSQVPANLDA